MFLLPTGGEAMAPSSLLRTFSRRLSGRLSPSPVSPWPPIRTTFDRWLMSELQELRPLNPYSSDRCTGASWLLKALDLAVAVQTAAAESIAAAGPHLSTAVDRRIVSGYAEDVVGLLDACNGLRERTDCIRRYVDSLNVALHCLEGEHEPSETVVGRARSALALCEAMEKSRCTELERRGSSLRKPAGENGRPPRDAIMMSGGDEAELDEALDGSRAVALFVVGALGVALSFKPKRGLPGVAQPSKTAAASWASSLRELHGEVKEEFDKRRRDGLVALDELAAAASSARSLREVLSRRVFGPREVKMAGEEVRRRCRELEERVRPLEGRVDELYKLLIGIRVSSLNGLGSLGL